MTKVIIETSRVLIEPEKGSYSVGEELVIDFKTGVLRKKRRGRRRAWVAERFIALAAQDAEGRVLVHINQGPRGGICR